MCNTHARTRRTHAGAPAGDRRWPSGGGGGPTHHERRGAQGRAAGGSMPGRAPAAGSGDLGRRLGGRGRGRQAAQSRADAALPIARSVSARQAWRADAERRGAESGVGGGGGGGGPPCPGYPPRSRPLRPAAAPRARWSRRRRTRKGGRRGISAQQHHAGKWDTLKRRQHNTEHRAKLCSVRFFKIKNVHYQKELCKISTLLTSGSWAYDEQFSFSTPLLIFFCNKISSIRRSGYTPKHNLIAI